MLTHERVILALDGLSREEVLALAGKIGSKVFAVKIHELFDLYGTQVIQELRAAGVRRIWVDHKLLDIPNTVGLRALALTNNGANIVSVHALGGIEMMRAAKQSGAIIYAITVLTSQEEADVVDLFGKTPAEVALFLALKAKEAGMDGVVCSPKEVASLSSNPDLQGLEFIVPGTRSPGVDVNDQKRVDTPSNALENGATRLVIGRQVTQAKDPLAALDAIAEEIAMFGEV